MFTIKLYRNDGGYQRIFEAESFTVLSGGEPTNPGKRWSEITAHVKAGDSQRFDVGDSPYEPNGGVWEKAIIENAACRTSQIIGQDLPLALKAAA